MTVGGVKCLSGVFHWSEAFGWSDWLACGCKVNKNPNFRFGNGNAISLCIVYEGRIGLGVSVWVVLVNIRLGSDVSACPM